LNAERLTGVQLTSVASNVACVVASKSESTLVCTSEASLDFGAEYGVRLDYQAVFDGEISTVPLPQPVVCTTTGCVAP
jgi:hypothetical protein